MECISLWWHKARPCFVVGLFSFKAKTELVLPVFSGSLTYSPPPPSFLYLNVCAGATVRALKGMYRGRVKKAVPPRQFVQCCLDRADKAQDPRNSGLFSSNDFQTVLWASISYLIESRV